MDFDFLIHTIAQLPAEQQNRLVFELAQRMGVSVHREVSGALRKRIQERWEIIEERGGPQVAGQLAELGAPRKARALAEDPA